MKRMLGIAVVGVALLAVVAQGANWQPLGVAEMAAYGATHAAEFSYKDFTVATTNTAQSFTNSIGAKTSVKAVGMLMSEAFDVGTTNFTGSCALKVGDGTDDDLFLASTELASDGSEVYVKFPPLPTYAAAGTSTSLKYAATNAPAVTVTRQTATLNYAATNNPGITLTTQVLTNLVYNGGATTGNVTIVTGVAATLTKSSLVVATNATATATLTAGSQTVVTAVTSATTAADLGEKLYATAGNVIFTFTPNANEALTSNTKGKVRVFFRMIKYPGN